MLNDLPSKYQFIIFASFMAVVLYGLIQAFLAPIILSKYKKEIETLSIKNAHLRNQIISTYNICTLIQQETATHPISKETQIYLTEIVGSLREITSKVF